MSKKIVNKVFDMCLASIKEPKNDWLVETIRFLIGEFMFIPNSDWMAIKHLEMRIPTIDGVNVSVPL